MRKKVLPLTEPEGRRGAAKNLKSGKVRKLVPRVDDMWYCAEQGDIMSMRNKLAVDKSWYKMQDKQTKNTLLMVACREGYVAMVDFLLKTDPEPEAAVLLKNKAGETATFMVFKPQIERKAIHSDRRRNMYFLEPGNEVARTTIMAFLLNAGADLFARDKDQDTVLHHACRLGWPNMTKLICERCDKLLLDVLNADDHFAIDLARTVNFPKGVELIELKAGVAPAAVKQAYAEEEEAEARRVEEEEAKLGDPELIRIAREKRKAQAEKDKQMKRAGGAMTPGFGEVSPLLKQQMEKAKLAQAKQAEKDRLQQRELELAKQGMVVSFDAEAAVRAEEEEAERPKKCTDRFTKRFRKKKVEHTPYERAMMEAFKAGTTPGGGAAGHAAGGDGDDSDDSPSTPRPEWVELLETVEDIDTDDTAVSKGATNQANAPAVRLRDTLRSVIVKCDDDPDPKAKDFKKRLNGCLAVGVFDIKDGRKAKQKALDILDSWEPLVLKTPEAANRSNDDDDDDEGEQDMDGETKASWDKRRRRSVAIAPPAGEEDSASKWQEYQDPESGQSFWYHEGTGESTWVKPKRKKRVKRMVPKPGTRRGEEPKEFWHKLQERSAIVQALPDLEGEHWEIWEHPDKGQYYHVPARDAFQWHKPGTDPPPVQEEFEEVWEEVEVDDDDDGTANSGLEDDDDDKDDELFDEQKGEGGGGGGLDESGRQVPAGERKKSLASQMWDAMVHKNHQAAKKRIGRGKFKGNLPGREGGTGKTHDKRKLANYTFDVGEVNDEMYDEVSSERAQYMRERLQLRKQLRKQNKFKKAKKDKEKYLKGEKEKKKLQ